MLVLIRLRGWGRRLNPDTLRRRPWARGGDKVTHTISWAENRATTLRVSSQHLSNVPNARSGSLCSVLCWNRQQSVTLYCECPFLTTVLSSPAESNAVRGDPPLSCQSTQAPHGACNSMVDAAAAFESIAQCPQELPQMMAAGKGWWLVGDTKEIFCVFTGKLAQPWKSVLNQGPEPGDRRRLWNSRKEKKKSAKSNLSQFSSFLFFNLISAICFLILFTGFISQYL